MPRPPRLELAGVPLHVVQRGNNRAACFFSEADRRFYLKCLAKSATRTGCLIHAFVLMTNHVHLLVTPGAPGSVGAMLQDIGRRYVRVINAIHGRTGTLWEGRFKSSLVDTERYLLTCHRYIELNPVRAGLAAHPSAYPWSSHANYVSGKPNDLINEHAAYLGLGATPAERQAAFRELFLSELDEATLVHIREAVNAGRPLGSPAPRKRRRSGTLAADDCSGSAATAKLL
ncbi:MAG: transposase [Betaproteobacteria bacterium]